MIKIYNQKALETFIRGLDGEISKFLSNSKPKSIADAYGYCIGFQNMEFRKCYTKARPTMVHAGPRNLIPIAQHLPQPQRIINNPRPIPTSLPMRRPPLPPRNNVFQRPYQPPPFQQCFPQQHFPQQPSFQQPFFNRPFQQQPFHQPPPQSPFRPFSQPPPQPSRASPFHNPRPGPSNAPEPMEVDSSIRSRQVNYSNRPQGSRIQAPPEKRQMLFAANTQDTETHDETTSDEEYHNYLDLYREQSIDDEEEGFEEAELNFLG